MFVYYAKLLTNFSEKMRSLMRATLFPQSLIDDVASMFENLKRDLSKAYLDSVDKDVPFCNTM